MSIAVQALSKSEVLRLISARPEVKLSSVEQQNFRKTLRDTTKLVAGFVDGKLLGICGVIRPTISDTRAYLWLYVTEHVMGNEFSFIRQSQIIVREMLEQFSPVMGHCQVGAKQSQKFLRLLGAKFGWPEGELIPFEIVRK